MNILLINYYWPPSGGSVVQRWLEITNSFEKEGIKSFVVTIDESVATFPVLDKSLEKKIVPTTKVFKTKSTSEKYHLYKKLFKRDKTPSYLDNKKGRMIKIARFIRGNIFIPDPRRGWNKHAFRLAQQLIKKHNIDCVITAGPPHSTHLVGKKLKKVYPQLIWLVDLHDYWSDSYYLTFFYRMRLAHYVDESMERQVLQQADLVMTHLNCAKESLIKRAGEEQKDKFVVHTMGYNESQFEDVPLGLKQNQFRIVYSGLMLFLYNPRVFFEAFKVALDKCQLEGAQLQLIGKMDNDIQTLVDELDLTNVVHFTGYLPHQEAVSRLKQGSALLTINPYIKEPKKNFWEKIFEYFAIHKPIVDILPGKIFEYLAAHKPIIDISPKGSEHRHMISSMNAGKSFDWTEKDLLIQHLIELMEQWKKYQCLDLPYNSIVKKYGRTHEAHLLAIRLKETIRSARGASSSALGV